MKSTHESPASQRRELFLKALEKTDLEERVTFLDRACGDDRRLRDAIDLLLAHHREDRFMEESPAGGAFTPDELGCPAEARREEAMGDRIGRYKLVQKVGEGGCGVVYMAEQEEPVRRRVALKVIKLGMDTKSVIARFDAERQALALMDHPNIAKVLEAGATESGRPYFVMELVCGVRITDYCDQHHLTTRDRLDLVIKLCHAIQHAHQKGIIHRDIKPSNILVTLQDGVALPKVIDFGIAKATTDQRLTDKTFFTALEQFIGTPAYMSPEQAEMSGLGIDTRSDIYSLGVLLYELLTGKTPFDTQELSSLGLDAMRRTIREQEPPRPSTRLSTMLAPELATNANNRQSESLKLIHLLRGEVDWIVMKCLEKDRARRYGTVSGLANDIQRYLNNEVVLARPPSAGYRFKKLVRRNKLAFGSAAVVTVALVLGMALSLSQRVKAQAAQKVAESEKQRANVHARQATQSQEQLRRLLYAADMNIAQQTLKQNNLGRARRLLDRHRPLSGQEDLRGWEWRYLWQLTRSSALVTLTNRSARGSSLSFSSDGIHLATGWWDGRVDLWSIPGKKVVRTLTEGGSLHRAHVAFAPVRNILLAASEPNLVTLYDLKSGQESILWRAPDPGEWDVRDLAFSQDGSRVVIYAGGSKTETGHAVWVVNVSSSRVECRHSTPGGVSFFSGSARLSPDNRHLYLTRSWQYRSRIQCLDVDTGRELWQTDPTRDEGITKLAISADGRLLASGTAFMDPTIRIWDAASGQLVRELYGHTAWISRLEFSKDGRRLISSSSDQSIRLWDTGKWTPTKVLRGHIDEVQALAISEPAQLIASTGKDGSLLLWQSDSKVAVDGYSLLPEDLQINDVLPVDHSRVLLLPRDQPPRLVDFKRDAAGVSLPEVGISTNILGCFGSNILCRWDGTNQIIIDELQGQNLIQRGVVGLKSSARPTGLAYNSAQQCVAWTEKTSASSVFLSSFSTPGRHVELKSDIAGLVPFSFSEDGNFLVARLYDADSTPQECEGSSCLRVWRVKTQREVVSVNERSFSPTFALGGRVLAVSFSPADDSEIRFYDLAHPDRPARQVHGRFFAPALAVSPDGRLVAASTWGGPVRLFDAATAEWIGDFDGHMNASQGVAFSPDGRRLISTFGGLENVKVWDVSTRQELLNLAGVGDSHPGGARWSADGAVILADGPWQVWRAPSWAEIEAAEAGEKSKSSSGLR